MISRPNDSPRRQRHRGFTLIELLVVIGIICILLAILLPVAGRVRIHAQTTRTMATMAAIAGACERYYSSEHSYPGLCSNAQLATGVPVGFTGGSGGGSELTGTENAVLSLSGGVMPDASGNPSFTTIDVSSSTTTMTIGKGPMRFGPVAMNRVRSAPYIEGAIGALLPQPPYSSSGCQALSTDLPGTPPAAAKDSLVPEYQDAYSQPRGIIYLRANNNASGVATPMSQKTPGTLQQYNTYEFSYYQRGAAPTKTDFPGDFQFGQGTIGDFEFWASETEYLQNPNIPNMPRGHNKFLLISAGPDRCFGTKDDLIYGAQ